MLSAQLFVSIAAVALAGWTLGVTNELIRERDRMRDRVIQLEETMAGRGIVVPATPNVVDEPVAVQDANAYPGGVGELAATNVTQNAGRVEVAPTRTATAPAPQAARPDFRRVIGELFSPPPPMRLVVLHVRAESDAHPAREIASDLIKASNVRTIIDVMPPGDPRQSVYVY